MIPYAWLAGALAVSLTVSGAYLTGRVHGVDAERGRQAEAVQRAVDSAMTIERNRQAEANRIIQEQADEQRTISSRLTIELERMRQRAARPSVPRDPAVNCSGATGRELSATDAAFLARLAARADELRAALAACYSYADGIR